MKSNQLEKMMKDRWHEQTELIATAAELMLRVLRVLDWPEKQDELFNVVLDDMREWFKRMSAHSDKMDVDLIFLRK